MSRSSRWLGGVAKERARFLNERMHVFEERKKVELDRA